MDASTLQWITSGITLGGVVIILRYVFTFSRWTGKVDMRLTNLEGWMKGHTAGGADGHG